MPKRCVKAGHSAFVACWRIGCRGPSGLRHNGIGFDLTRPDLRERTCNLGERQIDVSGKQILHHWRGTAIGHELDTRAGIFLKVGPDHVGAAANPRAPPPHPPPMPTVALPGLSLSQATRSGRFCGDSPDLPTSHIGQSAINAIGSKSFTTSNCNEKVAPLTTCVCQWPSTSV